MDPTFMTSLMLELMARGAPPPEALAGGSISGAQWFNFNCIFPDNAVTVVDLRQANQVVDQELAQVQGYRGAGNDLFMIIQDARYELPMNSETEAIQEAVRQSAQLHIRYDTNEHFVSLGPYIKTTGDQTALDAAAGPLERMNANSYGQSRGFRPFYVPFQRCLFEMVPRLAVNLANATSGNGSLWLYGYAWSRGDIAPPACPPSSTDQALLLRREGQRQQLTLPRQI
jgi:hypothetical protein